MKFFAGLVIGVGGAVIATAVITLMGLDDDDKVGKYFAWFTELFPWGWGWLVLFGTVIISWVVLFGSRDPFASLGRTLSDDHYYYRQMVEVRDITVNYEGLSDGQRLAPFLTLHIEVANMTVFPIRVLNHLTGTTSYGSGDPPIWTSIQLPNITDKRDQLASTNRMKLVLRQELGEELASEISKGSAHSQLNLDGLNIPFEVVFPYDSKAPVRETLVLPIAQIRLELDN
jgi:hypothetical protein